MIQEEKIIELPRRNIALVIVLSLVTFATYIGFWFLKRKDVFNDFGKHYVPFRLWLVATIFLIISFAHFLLGNFIFTPFGLVYIESYNIILTYLFIALLYYSIFRIKDVLEREFHNLELNKYLVFFFHIWYIQYKINQMHDYDEMERRSEERRVGKEYRCE